MTQLIIRKKSDKTKRKVPCIRPSLLNQRRPVHDPAHNLYIFLFSKHIAKTIVIQYKVSYREIYQYLPLKLKASSLAQDLHISSQHPPVISTTQKNVFKFSI